MILYTNGCSHSAGYELGTNSVWTRQLADTLWGDRNWNYFDVNEKLLDYNQPDDLEKLENWNKYFTLNNTLVNQARPSKGNDSIYFESMDMVQRLILLDKKPDFVVIQWSGVNRKIFNLISSLKQLNPYNIIGTSNAHDFTEMGLYLEPYASKHTLQLMISLQKFLNENNIEYVFIPYMELYKSEWMVELEQLDLSRFTTDPFKGRRNEFRKKCLVVDIQGHPNWLGHDYLLQKILDMFGLGELWRGYQSYEEWVEYCKLCKKPKQRKLMQYIKEYAYDLVDGTKAEIKNAMSKSI